VKQWKKAREGGRREGTSRLVVGALSREKLRERNVEERRGGRSLKMLARYVVQRPLQMSERASRRKANRTDRKSDVGLCGKGGTHGLGEGQVVPAVKSRGGGSASTRLREVKGKDTCQCAALKITSRRKGNCPSG